MSQRIITDFTGWRFLCCLLALFVPAQGDAADDGPLQFNRQIRPILADKCFRCHGPDAAARQADLRLDQRTSATEKRGRYRVIEPGSPAASELIQRITSTDPGRQMPPPDSGSVLNDGETAILREWIRQGATYEPHWSFVPPRRAIVPQTKQNAWARNPVDQFVKAKLDEAGLAPAVEADPELLLRRVTLDLTGLPPTPAEADAFAAASEADADGAYVALVDRLLASPRYGERMTLAWLDAARYADTNGYFTDNDRTMWPWRDWVIQAFNDNMPFDQFTIEQLAGDLLPETAHPQKQPEAGAVEDVATDAQDKDTLVSLRRRIATGFNRNHMINNETGIIEEEFRVAYVADRVDTTATVWMGLTLGCARCHDHKYDPITQRDYYRFFALFNNVPERGLAGSSGNAAPLLNVSSSELESQIARMQREVREAARRFAAIEPQLDAAQSAWELSVLDHLPPPRTAGLIVHLPLDGPLTADAQQGTVALADGLIKNAASFDGDGCVLHPDGIDVEQTDAFAFGAWIRPEGPGCVISKMDDASAMRGFDVTLRKGKAVVNLVNQWNRNAIQVASVASLPSRQWQHVFVTYDGSGRAAGIHLYLDGQPAPVEVELDCLSGSIRNAEPLRIGRRQASASFRGLIDDVRVYDRVLAPAEVTQLVTSQLVRGIISRPAESRDENQKRKLRAKYLSYHAREGFAQASAELDRLRRRQRELLQSVPTTMVMQDAEQARETFVLIRGEYDQQGDAVMAGVPEFLVGPSPDMDAARRWTRLDMARWLVDPAHPLTSRVIVNRLWQRLFGTGIVKTADDFGTQGEPPTHPELLDWLAVELVESGWDLKRLLRLIVTSATYRQSSHCDPRLRQRDRENRLLARGPRFRLDAETLRDNALAISGLLVERIGGPSVKPYQPAGIWDDVAYDGDGSYQESTGASLYRRSMYSFWKRQAPPPNMLVFDATTRETCIVTRSRTNTPLQALALMNDPTFVEASRQLAERAMRAAPTAAERVDWAFRAATSRHPKPSEVRTLLAVLDAQREVFANAPDKAANLLRVGASQRDESLDMVELAAWTTVTNIILCLDETITRP